MKDLTGKKLLILGGAFQHCKLVEAAHELGVITWVTDYLPSEQAPAKQMADHYSMLNITQIDEMAELCRKEGIDGVIATSLDACQKPYEMLCRKLGVPCFGSEEQFRILTDKRLFKEHCRKFGVDVIPEYAPEDFDDPAVCAGKVSFPILIKPCESRGSRGQTICHSYEEVADAIAFARSESANGQIVIEKYMGQNNDFSMTILMLGGKAYPFRTVDRILGKYEDGLDKLAVGATMPSVFTKLYMDNVHSKVEKLYQGIGLVNAPVFMQGFVDGDTVRFYDPGLRLPGGEYERMFTHACGVNPMYPLIEFALTGQVENTRDYLKPDAVWLDGKLACQVLPTLRPGIIGAVKGMDEIRAHPHVVSAFERFRVGDEIKPTKNVNQRFSEIDVVCSSSEEMSRTVHWIYDTLSITDENGEDMIVSSFSPSIIRQRGELLGI
ncbi:MAG: hypothetical protein J6J43_07330 [Oscillospiraceae bacterium]|nr:hypothetical protein [Oscillospiraceae bacterium]